jgi:hypothetical protein
MTDMTRRDLRPYFLWDEDVSIGELKEVLAGPDSPRRDELLGKMLREARDIDVWQFVRPAEVAGALERLRRRLGCRYAFWSFLIEGWRRYGLLGAWRADRVPARVRDAFFRRARLLPDRRLAAIWFLGALAS